MNFLAAFSRLAALLPGFWPRSLEPLEIRVKSTLSAARMPNFSFSLWPFYEPELLSQLLIVSLRLLFRSSFVPLLFYFEFASWKVAADIDFRRSRSSEFRPLAPNRRHSMDTADCEPRLLSNPNDRNEALCLFAICGVCRIRSAEASDRRRKGIADVRAAHFLDLSSEI